MFDPKKEILYWNEANLLGVKIFVDLVVALVTPENSWKNNSKIKN